MPTVSLKTVCETLTELVQLGEMTRLNLGAGAWRFDPNTDAHHHLVCVECGAVCDFYADFGHIAVPPDQQFGFVIRSKEVTFRGLCRNCAGAPSRTRPGAGHAEPQN